MKPAHKHVGPNGPGQIINDITLGDYLERKYPEETKKKLTFDEWWDSGRLSKDNPHKPISAEWWALEGWKAAQENV